MNIHLLGPDFGRRLLRDTTASPPLEVREHDRLRWLHFGNSAVQTVIDLRSPHTVLLPYLQAMLCALYFQEHTHTVLNLGAGGGSVERFFERFDQNIRVDSVEANPRVLQIARDYFGFNYPCRLQSAEVALEDSARSYDLIICDIYSSESGRHVYRYDFLTNISRCIGERGIGVLNYLPESESEALVLLQTARRVFRFLAILEVPNFRNLIVFCAHESLVAMPRVKSSWNKKEVVTQGMLPEIGLLDNLRRVSH